MQHCRKTVLLPLNCYLDSKQLHEVLYFICPVLDKRLRAEIETIHKILEIKQINSLNWTSREEQLANYLEKGSLL